MRYSAALPTDVHARAAAHLLRGDRQEDLCFAVWFPSQGRDRLSALLHDVVLPNPGDRRVHGNASFEPQLFERAIAMAVAANGGIAFLHSHLGPGWQGMSRDDVVAELRLAPSVAGATGLPLVGLTLGTDGAWSARFWERTGPREYARCWCESVRVAGESLAMTYNDTLLPPSRPRREQRRTISAWGERTQSHIVRLRIGVVGAGSVGSVVAESLARVGIADMRLLDFDAVETLNLDRLLHATHRDVGQPKVSVVARALRKSATARPFSVEPLDWSIVEEQGFRAALDCDVLFSCVDRPWPRHVLNLIAYSHLIPVVDGGIAIRTCKGGEGVRHADLRAHVATPTRRCLACLGQYDPGLVSLERDGYLDDPTYIAGLPEGHPLRRKENVFPFSVTAAGFEVFQMLSMIVRPLGIANPGAHIYHFVNGRLDIEHSATCDPDCYFPTVLARGDRSGIDPTGTHAVAEQARAARTGLRAAVRRLKWRLGL